VKRTKNVETHASLNFRQVASREIRTGGRQTRMHFASSPCSRGGGSVGKRSWSPCCVARPARALIITKHAFTPVEVRPRSFMRYRSLDDRRCSRSGADETTTRRRYSLLPVPSSPRMRAEKNLFRYFNRFQSVSPNAAVRAAVFTYWWFSMADARRRPIGYRPVCMKHLKLF